MSIDPIKLRARIFEADLLQYRGFRVESTGFIAAKSRLDIVDALARGDWKEAFGDETSAVVQPHIMNLVQTSMNDISTLVMEATPSVKCLPDKETKTSEDKANVREAVADTYWEVNAGDALVPLLAMDLAGAGFACLVAYPDADSPYPCVQRVNPRFAYPDMRDGKVLDLLVVESVNQRVASQLFPDLGIVIDPEVTNSTVEIIHYYSKEECLEALSWEPLIAGREGTSVGARKAHIIKR